MQRHLHADQDNTTTMAVLWCHRQIETFCASTESKVYKTYGMSSEPSVYVHDITLLGDR